MEDQEIDIKECLQTPLPKVPIGPTISAHWLAIDGIQPRIPQNPIQILPPKQINEKKKGLFDFLLLIIIRRGSFR